MVHRAVKHCKISEVPAVDSSFKMVLQYMDNDNI